jgi:hypothetical protein
MRLDVLLLLTALVGVAHRILLSQTNPVDLKTASVLRIFPDPLPARNGR